MSEHPISQLVGTAMKSIKEMIDVNTIVGEAVETPDGTVLIPISRVSFGFGAGGSEFGAKGKDKEKEKEQTGAGADNGLFGGGTGAGVSINPVAFLIVTKDGVKLLPINSNGSAIDKLVDYIPYAIEKCNDYIKNRKKEKFE
jgi:sporulation protein YtfJ